MGQKEIPPQAPPATTTTSTQTPTFEKQFMSNKHTMVYLINQFQFIGSAHEYYHQSFLHLHSGISNLMEHMGHPHPSYPSYISHLYMPYTPYDPTYNHAQFAYQNIYPLAPPPPPHPKVHTPPPASNATLLFHIPWP